MTTTDAQPSLPVAKLRSAPVLHAQAAARAKVEGFSSGRILRPSTKVLPEDVRAHNRSLVLQMLYRGGRQSRADIARLTRLTRVTVSDLVAELIAEDLIIEIGKREDSRPGKPATLLDINRGGLQIVGLDLSEYSVFCGAVLDLDGQILQRVQAPLAGSTGADATAKVIALAEALVSRTTAPILGMGVGSPGVVDAAGVVLSAPNLGWSDEPLQDALATRFGIPVIVGNDARAAVLAEHSFGGAGADMILIKVGHGVGSGLLLNGSLLFGSRFAAGEIGHVIVGTHGGAECACGRSGCLETWLAAHRLGARVAAAQAADPSQSPARAAEPILAEAGRHLGIALAPVLAALNVAEIVLCGPSDLLDGPLAEATIQTLRERTMAEVHGDLVVRMTTLGEDIVIRGAAVMVLSGQLGVS
jgi:predicted NBD/HSP70 family sugar kinase